MRNSQSKKRIDAGSVGRLFSTDQVRNRYGAITGDSDIGSKDKGYSATALADTNSLMNVSEV